MGCKGGDHVLLMVDALVLSTVLKEEQAFPNYLLSMGVLTLGVCLLRACFSPPSGRYE